VGCEEDGLEEKIYAKFSHLSAVELTAIQLAMQHISRQEAERNLILTDTLTRCAEGHGNEIGRTNLATRIVLKAATTKKQIIIKWKADELAKKGTTDGTSTNYRLQCPDHKKKPYLFFIKLRKMTFYKMKYVFLYEF
jgi:hypothetical protein